MRLYGFDAKELTDEQNPQLDLQIDPKLAWALRNRHVFPLEINTADYEMIVRVPGIGLKSAKKIVAARRFAYLSWENLKQIGVVIKRAKYFITCGGRSLETREWDEEAIRRRILFGEKGDRNGLWGSQLDLFQQAS